MKQKKIEIQGIGDVLLEQSPRARRMNLTLRPFRGIRVAVPPGVSFGAAENFARSKSGWMMARLPRLRAAEQEAIQRRASLPAAAADPKIARARLVERLNVLSAEFGLPYNRVSVRNQKTRWGSCSAKKNINLNVNLAGLPEKLMDYALLHELVHTREMNHGRPFWDLLENFVKNARLLDRELKTYRLFPDRQE